MSSVKSGYVLPMSTSGHITPIIDIPVPAVITPEPVENKLEIRAQYLQAVLRAEFLQDFFKPKKIIHYTKAELSVELGDYAPAGYDFGLFNKEFLDYFNMNGIIQDVEYTAGIVIERMKMKKEGGGFKEFTPLPQKPVLETVIKEEVIIQERDANGFTPIPTPLGFIEQRLYTPLMKKTSNA